MPDAVAGLDRDTSASELIEINMHLIEQATQRLEELQRAGIVMPWIEGSGDAAMAARTAQVSTLPPVHSTLPHGLPTTNLPRPSQIEPATQVTLDFAQLRQTGVLASEQDRTRITHQFRNIKLPLLVNARTKADEPEHRRGLIMLTSALPNEGKTFCAINLAISMAMEVDTSVLLIDADLIRPSLFSRLGLKLGGPGLLDLLTREDLSLHETVVATNVPKLLLMTSGEKNRRSTELLVSASMDRLLARLAKDYANHLIIFDAPPLLLTTDSSALASKVGQVVVVVEANRTPRASILKAFASLRNCPIVFSILNKSGLSGDEKKHDYYY